MQDIILFITIIFVVINMVYFFRLYFLDKNIKKNNDKENNEILCKKFTKEFIISIILGVIIFILSLTNIIMRIL